MIKNIIAVIVLLIVALGLFTLAKSFNLKPVQQVPDPTTYEVVEKSKDFVLGVGETGTFEDFSITLNKVVQDSRCPIDVQCIQAGSVTANVSIIHEAENITKDLQSGKDPEIIGGHKVSITNIEPAKESKKEIAPEDYKITFHLEM